MSNRLFFSSLIVFLALFLSGCTSRPSYIAITGYAQGGTYTVKINLEGRNGGPLAKNPEQIKHDIDSILSLIDTTMSGYNKESILTKFNNGEPVKSNDLLKEIYSFSYGIYEKTDGAVDVAAGPLFDAWGFGFTTDSLPDPSEVQKVMDSCGMGRLKKEIETREDGILYPEDMLLVKGGNLPKLNFNAIAQGYSCDVVADYLHGIGVKDMLVDIGEIRCEGLNPNGQPWTIAVDRPVDGNNTLGADTDGVWQSDGSDCGIVTSGNYRKFIIKDGKKFAHTIDPRIGYPVDHSLLSATIVAPDGATADAYATYCMVLGLEDAIKFIESDPTLEGYLIYDNDGEMNEWCSEGFNLIGK